MTRAEVVHLLSALPRDSAGLVSFHDAQKLIVRYREEQIARFKVIFPQIVTGSAKKRQDGTVTSATDNINRDDAEACSAEQAAGPGSGYLNETAAGRAKVGNTLQLAERTPRGSSWNDGKMRGGRKARKTKFSADVAPAEMFIKDMGLTPAGVASQVSLRLPPS